MRELALACALLSLRMVLLHLRELWDEGTYSLQGALSPGQTTGLWPPSALRIVHALNALLKPSLLLVLHACVSLEQ